MELNKSANIQGSTHGKELTSRIIQGDKSAFEKVYFEHHKQLYYVALRYVKDPKLAEDAVQDIFLKLWIKRQDLNPALSLKNYLYTSLKNHLLNIIRNNKTAIEKQIEISWRQKSSANYTEQQFFLSEYQNIIDEGIAKMSDRKREIFNLKTYKGLSNDEVAAKLNISVNTVKSLNTQAVKFLKDYLKTNSDINAPLFILLCYYIF